MSSQRPFFLSTFFSSIRQQRPAHQQPNKPPTSTSPTTAANGAPSTSTTPSAGSAPRSIPSQSQPPQSRSPGVLSPRGGVPIPGPNRRRGSDSSSEGFREVKGSDKWYIGGRTAAGEEKYFKVGVMKRVRSSDGFSIDKLSL